jgi:hypothetical protein
MELRRSMERALLGSFRLAVALPDGTGRRAAREDGRRAAVTVLVPREPQQIRYKHHDGTAATRSARTGWLGAALCAEGGAAAGAVPPLPPRFG